MYILLIFIPFLTFLIFLTLGRKIGKEGAIKITKIVNIIQIIFINIIGYEIIFNENKIEIQIFLLNWDKWIYTDIFNNIISIKYDINSILLTELIIIIFTIVINYSIWYLKEDPYIIRFLSKLFLFCFMMLILVLSNNYIIMLLGWEYVGLTSYLLINYWYTRMQANKSSIKAILLNKIGDIGLILGIIILINNINNNLIKNINTIYYIYSKYTIYIIIFFILAAFAKSAQIFLHSWLKDAMEAPTPVSALLHAATMVTAGVYILLKILPIFCIDSPHCPDISGRGKIESISLLDSIQPDLVLQGLLANQSAHSEGSNIFYNYVSGANMTLTWACIICLLTIIIGGLSSLFQYDIKKIIAFSTMSQLGYMFIGNLIGCYNNSYNHLIIHGFFKALLFLSAGIIIHSIINEQDIRKFGSLIYSFPYTYFLFLIGTLAIISWPIFSGFYSKDILLENTKLSYNFIYIFTILGAFITTIYSIKLIKLIFFLPPLPSNLGYRCTILPVKEPVIDRFFNHEQGNPVQVDQINISKIDWSDHVKEANNVSFFDRSFNRIFGFCSKSIFEPKWNIFLYLNILVLGSIFLGYYMKDIILYPIIYENFYPFYTLDYEFIPFLYKILPLLIVLFGIYIGIIINNKDIYILKKYNLNILRKNIQIEKILGSIIYFDFIYNLILKKFLFFSYQNIYKYIDKGFLEIFSFLGIYRTIKFSKNIFPQLTEQSGTKIIPGSLRALRETILFNKQPIRLSNKINSNINILNNISYLNIWINFIFLSFFLIILIYIL